MNMRKMLKFMGVLILFIAIMPMDVMADEAFSGMALTDESVNHVEENVNNESEEEIPSEQQPETEVVPEEEIVPEENEEVTPPEEESDVTPQADQAQEEKVQDVSVTGQMHVQNIGWMNNDGSIFGTNGKGLRVEAIKVNVSHPTISGGIKYQSLVQNVGWQASVSNGQLSGTQSRSLGSIQIYV